jgi:PAS domain S-box-containing protein
MSGARLDLEGRCLLHGICRDVSERKRAEETLRETRETLREQRDFTDQVLETANVLIFVVDARDRIVRFNATCAAVFGFSEEEVRGKVYRDLPPWSPSASARKTVSPLMNMNWGNEELMNCKGMGGERLIAWRNSTVRDPQGQVRYVIHTGVDVTEQRHLEARLRQARKLETLGTLVGGIAHDFNNQLTAILGHLSMVLSDLGEIPAESLVRPMREPLKHAERAAQRCADITQRLLTFSSGRVGPTSTVALDSLLAETERALRTLRRECPASVRIRVQAVQAVQAGSSSLWPVAGDGTQLEEVLLELARNACDAMPFGGLLTVSAVNRVFAEADCALNVEARPGRFVELTVADTGNGMPPEIQAHLFEPFFTTKKMGQGAGMGLAMAYGIVKAHKGWITVDSTPGEGTTFHVYLPAVEPEARQESESPATTSTTSTTSLTPDHRPLTPACILVVDDEDLVRALAEAVLQRWGYRVLGASDGEEALEVYRQAQARGTPVDLVLLDYSMPKMTGLQVFVQLQKINPRVCVVFSSGYTMDKDSDQLLASGAKAFIPKPYRPDDLIRVVRDVLAETANNQCPATNIPSSVPNPP